MVNETMHRSVQLGLKYLLGVDVDQDPRRGTALIERAAKKGDAEAAYLCATLASSPQWRAANWEVAMDHLVVAAERGHEVARSTLRILAAGPVGGISPVDEWQALRNTVDHTAWQSVPPAETLSESPYIRAIPSFVSPEVCDWIVARARENLTRATIYDNVTGGDTEDYRRTNSQCDLNITNCGMLTFLLRSRISGCGLGSCFRPGNGSAKSTSLQAG